MSNKKLFNTEDFMFGRKGPLARLLANFILWAFGAFKANRAYEHVMAQEDQTLDTITRELKITVDIDQKSLSNIPETGPVIIICNHPTGIVDGILMLHAITRVRQDVKVLGNYLLGRVEPIMPYLIAVNPFEEREGGNLKGLKLGLRHIANGGCLLLCPAGEVSTWQRGWHHIADKQWDSAAIKFMRKTGATIVPGWIEGKNSLLFRMLGKIHPRLRTAMLCHEVFNKRGKTFPITLGAPLSSSRLQDLPDLESYHNYLRASVDYLKNCRTKPVRSLEDIAKDQGDMGDIIPAIDKDVLANEIASLEGSCKIFDHGERFEVYIAPSAAIPNLMQEIGRLREVTFRSIGEGSMKSCDLDQYDAYYHQLFIWDKEARALVGAYRMGFGGEIMPKYGLDGFYTHSLFRYEESLKDMLSHSIELGRSFITADYQRKPTSLLMLWRGIFAVLLSKPNYRYLVGPVTISGEFQCSSKTIIMTHLQQHYFNAEIAAHIHPRTGTKGIDAPIDKSLIEKIDNTALIDKIICDIEKDERAMPVLVKKYLQLNSRVVGFNVDHDFCDALDALMVLDLELVPEQRLQMLKREVNGSNSKEEVKEE